MAVVSFFVGRHNDHQVYLDTQSLKQNALSLKDFKELVIQRTAVAEQLTADHLLLQVRRWYPVAQTLGALVEVRVWVLLALLIFYCNFNIHVLSMCC